MRLTGGGDNDTPPARDRDVIVNTLYCSELLTTPFSFVCGIIRASLDFSSQLVGMLFVLLCIREIYMLPRMRLLIVIYKLWMKKERSGFVNALI